MNAFPAVEFDVTTASEAGALIYWQRKEEQSLEVREDTEFRWLLLDGVVQSVLRHTAPDELCLPVTVQRDGIDYLNETIVP